MIAKVFLFVLLCGTAAQSVFAVDINFKLQEWNDWLEIGGAETPHSGQDVPGQNPNANYFNRDSKTGGYIMYCHGQRMGGQLASQYSSSRDMGCFLQKSVRSPISPVNGAEYKNGRKELLKYLLLRLNVVNATTVGAIDSASPIEINKAAAAAIYKLRNLIAMAKSSTPQLPEVNSDGALVARGYQRRLNLLNRLFPDAGLYYILMRSKGLFK